MYSTWMNKHVINAKEMLKTGHCDGFALPALKLLQLKKHGFDTNTEANQWKGIRKGIQANLETMCDKGDDVTWFNHRSRNTISVIQNGSCQYR